MLLGALAVRNSALPTIEGGAPTSAVSERVGLSAQTRDQRVGYRLPSIDEDHVEIPPMWWISTAAQGELSVALASGHREFECGDLAKRFAQRLYGAVEELLA